jgi:hypothetical protein
LKLGVNVQTRLRLKQALMPDPKFLRSSSLQPSSGRTGTAHAAARHEDGDLQSIKTARKCLF